MRNLTTPLARSKSAAMTRVLDLLSRGYIRYTCGTISAAKLESLANKFHRIYAIAATPAQRITRKKHKQANAALVLYCPEGADLAHWLLLFTEGELGAHEKLRNIEDKPRLQWLGYELTRYAHKEKTRWTWRRPSTEMQELYAFLGMHLSSRNTAAVKELLQRAANQPGFHGVREQTRRLCDYAFKNGYRGERPHLFYMTKVSHGVRLRLLGNSCKKYGSD